MGAGRALNLDAAPSGSSRFGQASRRDRAAVCFVAGIPHADGLSPPFAAGINNSIDRLMIARGHEPPATDHSPCVGGEVVSGHA